MMSRRFQLSGVALLALSLVSCNALFGSYNNPHDPLNASHSSTSTSSSTPTSAPPSTPPATPPSAPSAPPSYLYVTNDNSTTGTGGLSSFLIGSGGGLTALTSGTSTTSAQGYPYGIAITPNGSYLYVANGGTSTGTGGLSAYAIGTAGALSALTPATYTTGSAGGAAGIAITPNGAYLYVVNSGSSAGVGGLSGYSIGSSGALTPLTNSPFATGTSGSPFAVAITPDGSDLYVANAGSSAGVGGLTGYTIATTGDLQPIATGTFQTGSSGGPEGIAISPDGSYLYVTNHGSASGTGGLSAFTIGTGGALSPITTGTLVTGAGPFGIAVSPNGSYLYVTNNNSTNGQAGISAYAIGSGGALTPFTPATYATSSAGNPMGVTISPNGSYLYAGNLGSGSNPGDISGFTIGSNGTLTPMSPATFPTSSVGGPAVIAITP